jgi:ornithine cyclodeaminase/alanine dehydrogenase
MRDLATLFPQIEVFEMGKNRSQLELEPDIAESSRNNYERESKSAVAERKRQQLLYLSQADVEDVGLSMAEIITALERAFREKAEGRVQMPPKPGIQTRPSAFIHAMLAYIPALNAAGLKCVAGYPDNRKRGLPYINGLLILNDPETGVPLTVMDCGWITSKRTGAATAVAAKYLARPESESVGILGCGVQGRGNLEALNLVFHIKRVRVYDVDPKVREACAAEMSAQLGLDVVAVTDPREAVVDADIVITAGPILCVPHATIRPGWLGEGAFASLVDFDSYWHPDALREADKFCTDDVPQLEYYRQLGYFQSIPPIHADLGQLIMRRKAGRETATERTITCNLGLAIEDVAVGALVYKRALENNLGTWITL